MRLKTRTLLRLGRHVYSRGVNKLNLVWPDLLRNSEYPGEFQVLYTIL